MPKVKKSKKARRRFPLFLHATGQYAKNMKGKTHYFGTDPDAALSKYLEERDEIQAGKSTRTAANHIPPSHQISFSDLRLPSPTLEDDWPVVLLV